MGRRRAARLRYRGKIASGQALLETDHLLFRGDVRLKIPFAEIASLAARDGALHVAFGDQTAVFELESGEAETWIGKIRNPPSLLDKLGVKPEDLVCVIGVRDDAFRAALAARLGSPARTRAVKDAALIFYGADSIDDLERLRGLRASLRPNGAIWVVSRKGTTATLKDTEVMAAAKDAGLVDTKVVAFSPTHTALKLVIPVALR
jgi:hypothetical protein